MNQKSGAPCRNEKNGSIMPALAAIHMKKIGDMANDAKHENLFEKIKSAAGKSPNRPG
nr:hypothetical protein [uncultured Ottowia sp.]